MSDDRFEQVRCAADGLAALCDGVVPRALVVLGSGLGGVLDSMEVAAEMPFATLPGYAAACVVGHAGTFVSGTLSGVPVLATLGRIHLYEGHPADRVVLPVRAAALLGCRTFLATNAAGGIAPDLRVGQTMLVTDHVNLMGANPLVGPNIDEIGVRFPGMADAYSPRLRSLAHEVADSAGVELAEGVYAGVLGPNYETRAEIRYLRAIGADAVGMSTVPEVIAARHAGMEIAALSLIANVAGEMTDSHEHVLAAVEAGAGAMARIVAGILARL
jgi:inosine/guanosine/xanthosine phosphorylase family protein